MYGKALLRKQYEEILRENDSLIQERDRLKARVAELEGAFDELQIAKDCAEQCVDDADAELAQAVGERDQLRDEVKKLKEFGECWFDRAHELEDELKRWTE